MLRARRFIVQARNVPICAFVGPNGSGKSLAMVAATAPSLAAGRRVLSTVRLLSAEAASSAEHALDAWGTLGLDPCREPMALPHPAYRPLIDYCTLLDAVNCDVLLDEVTGVASSRDSQSMPIQVANFLVQMRRRDVTLRWTSPNWARADRIIREVSQAVVYCRGYLPEPVVEDGVPRLWGSRRVFWWRMFDAFDFDEFTAYKREQTSAKGWCLYRRNGWSHQNSYDSLDAVEALGAATEAGLCLVCGGRRSAPKCGCGPSLPRPAPRHPVTVPATWLDVPGDGLSGLLPAAPTPPAPDGADDARRRAAPSTSP